MNIPRAPSDTRDASELLNLLWTRMNPRNANQMSVPQIVRPAAATEANSAPVPSFETAPLAPSRKRRLSSSETLQPSPDDTPCIANLPCVEYERYGAKIVRTPHLEICHPYYDKTAEVVRKYDSRPGTMDMLWMYATGTAMSLQCPPFFYPPPRPENDQHLIPSVIDATDPSRVVVFVDEKRRLTMDPIHAKPVAGSEDGGRRARIDALIDLINRAESLYSCLSVITLDTSAERERRNKAAEEARPVIVAPVPIPLGTGTASPTPAPVGPVPRGVGTDAGNRPRGDPLREAMDYLEGLGGRMEDMETRARNMSEAMSALAHAVSSQDAPSIPSLVALALDSVRAVNSLYCNLNDLVFRLETTHGLYDPAKCQRVLVGIGRILECARAMNSLPTAFSLHSLRKTALELAPDPSYLPSFSSSPLSVSLPFPPPVPGKPGSSADRDAPMDARPISYSPSRSNSPGSPSADLAVVSCCSSAVPPEASFGYMLRLYAASIEHLVGVIACFSDSVGVVAAAIFNRFVVVASHDDLNRMVRGYAERMRNRCKTQRRIVSVPVIQQPAKPHHLSLIPGSNPKPAPPPGVPPPIATPTPLILRSVFATETPYLSRISFRPFVDPPTPEIKGAVSEQGEKKGK